MATTIYHDGVVPRNNLNPNTRLQQSTTVVVLHRDVYDKFEAQFRPVQPNEQTTAIQVGYALGVQAVLKALRGALVAE